jgi:RHS repeat-associated protein
MRRRNWKSIPILAILFLFFLPVIARAAAPHITSLTPNTGAVGSSIVIAGSNFGSTKGSSTVKFNGTTATTTSWGASSITATVPTGATTGNVVVTVSGSASNGVTFTVTAAPSITSLTPNTGAVGSSIVIAGSNFGPSQGNGNVKFNGTSATTITSWGASSITATVPSGATTGNVVVTAAGGVASSGVTFTVTAAPSITSLTPNTGAVGSSIVIAGSNFGPSQGNGNVKFNGTSATTITSWGASSITATVPSGATTGNVVVTAAGGVASSGVTFTVTAVPSITSLTPNTGAVGSSIVIAGSNFGPSQGNGNVKFNGTSATTITSWGASSITATVPSGSTTGNVVVTAAGGVASSGVTFTVTGAPSITSLTPNTGAVGSSIVIAGSNFGPSQGNGSVKFNGTSATTITSWGASSITATVPSGATTGNVVVTAAGGIASSGVTFTVTAAPSITSLTPNTGAVGSSIVIAGSNFGATQGNGGVTFNGTSATTVTSWGASSITATAPSGATTGSVVVTAAGGVPSSGVNFTVVPAPSITSLSVTSGAVGTAVTVTGSNFGSSQGTGAVTFNGTTASVTSWGASSIGVTVPNGATTGNVVVTAAGGVASNGTNFTVLPTPSITSLSVTSGAVGTPVTITGTNFGASQGTSTVTFNGTTATPANWSITSITVPVPSGATTGNVVVSVGGVSSNGIAFTVLPGISGLSATIGAVGAAITITGTNFGSSQGSSTVTFNGTPTTPTSWSTFTIGAPVPSGATTGNVVVTVAGAASSGVNFTVVPAPSITNLSVTSGVVGTPVTITGANFGATQGTSTVTFNGTGALPSSWNSTSIVVPVPSGATTGNVAVNASGVASNGINFTVVETLSITNLSPTSGAIGSEVAITGTGFGATQGSSTISLNNTTVPVASWSDSSIIANVPSGASSGPFSVTVGGHTVNSATFSVTTLPAGWSDGDIGSVGVAGGGTYANGTFTVTGAGLRTWGSSDGIHFVYQSLTGDGTIVARLVSLQTGNSGPLAGVMIRETLDPASTFAFTMYYQNFTYLQERASTGVASTYQGGSNVSPPIWLKLVRTGNTFNGYTSYNGVTWIQVGTTQTINMAQNIYVGLAVSSGNTSTTVAAAFDNVSINSTAAQAPVITSVSATTGSIGSQVEISGSGFGASENGSLVTLNNAPVTINSWSSASIVFTIPAGGTTGYLVASIAPSMNDSNPVFFTVTSQPLPASWLDQDVGQVQYGGSATYTNGTFTVNGSGLQIGGTSDQMHFVYQSLQGDGTIIARVVSTSGSTYTQAGVMIRETLDPSAKHAFVGYQGQSQLECLWDRTTTGGSTSVPGCNNAGVPYWLKLVRSGSTFSGYSSPNGNTWTQLGSAQTISMAQTVYVGLAVSSNTAGGLPASLATGTFDNVSINSTALPAPVITSVSATTGSIGGTFTINGTGYGASQNGSLVLLNDAPLTINTWSNTSISVTIPTGATSGYLLVSVAPSMNDSNAVFFTVTANPLPTPWLDQDVGQVQYGGSATYTNGTFTVNGSGLQIGGTSDQMHFVYQSLQGDGTIIARVVSTSGSTYTQAGVMIRETLDPSAKHAFVGYQGQSQLECLWDRTTTGGSTSVPGCNNAGVPYWLKLVRSGSTFSGYSSPNGNTWTQLGSAQTISMAQTVYVGLAVSSNTAGGLPASLATGTFDNVSINLGTTPFVTGLLPTLGTVGTSVTITGTSFGAAQGTSTVGFNGALATSITSWSDTQIVALVPTTAVSGTSPVVVTVNSIPSLSNLVFTVIHPIISSLSPPAAQIGGSITLNGAGFGSSQGNSTVQFNSVGASVSSWSDTSITVAVPANATNGPVSVTEYGITSGGVQFTVIEAVSVTGVSPNVGPIGSTITITGAGFGPTQSNSTANLYGATATNIVSWSDTQIVALVPAGASTGAVNVQVAGITAYGPWFTLNTTVQATDSLGNFSAYTSELIGGTWVPVNSEGSGCSSCTLRGAINYTYDNHGNVSTRMDELGHITSYTYDSNGNVASVTVPITSSTSATTSYTYNSFGQVLTTTDPMGNVTTNTYDTHGNLLTVTTPPPNGSTAASVTTFTYDSKGELLTIKDPLNNVTTLTYYPTGLINTITDAQQNVTTYVYDAHGNRTSVTDAMSNQTTFAYDTGDRLKTIAYPGSTGTTTFGYDYRGRRTSVTDQNSKTTTYAYDDADRMTSVTDAATPGNVTTYGYDSENNLTSIQDANGHTTSFSYDAFGRVAKTTFPSGYIETYGYDAVGNLTSKTDRKNQLITYTYDQLNRLTQKAYPDTTAVNYTYDNDSRLTQVTDPSGTYQFTFDNMGRLTNTTTSYAFLVGRNFTTSYGYDAASNRTGFTDPESGATSYVYDTLNRLQTLTPPSAFSGTGNFGFTYDALSRRTQMTRPNGLKSIYAYDNLSRLQSVLHQSGSTTLDGAAYAVDNAGNRTSRTPQPTGAASNYAYDNIYELTGVTQNSATTESYTYDPVGNRLSSLGVSSYTNNSSNELTSTPTTTYTYDNNGNTQTKVVGSNTTTYAWDFENRMSSVTLPAGGGTVTFAYDPFGRRIKKVTSTTTSVFAYDGDNIIEETNSSGAAVARYEPTQNIDEPLTMLRSGATSYYHSDGLGSVTSLSNAAGSIANTYTYDSFGKLTASTGSLVNPFQYTARESDTETGLYYYRARYYDTSAGRFINEDPLGFRAGSNLYRYAINAPVNWQDPDGTLPGLGALWKSYWDAKDKADWLKCFAEIGYCLKELPNQVKSVNGMSTDAVLNNAIEAQKKGGSGSTEGGQRMGQVCNGDTNCLQGIEDCLKSMPLAGPLNPPSWASDPPEPGKPKDPSPKEPKNPSRRE